MVTMNLIRRCDLKCLLLLKGCVNLASWLPLAEGQSSRSLLWTILEFRVDMCDSWIPHFGGEKFKQDNRMFNLHSDVICYHKKDKARQRSGYPWTCSTYFVDSYHTHQLCETHPLHEVQLSPALRDRNTRNCTLAAGWMPSRLSI